jgi:hypothetical protein
VRRCGPDAWLQSQRVFELESPLLQSFLSRRCLYIHSTTALSLCCVGRGRPGAEARVRVRNISRGNGGSSSGSERGDAGSLLIRGPGVAAGSTTDKLVTFPDFMPTFLELGGIAIPGYVDGTSLVPLLNSTVADWRNAILLEGHESGSPERDYFAIRTAAGLKYIEYRSGFKEFYDLASDPYEMNSNPSSAPAALVDRLQRLQTCAADTCRAIEREDSGSTTPPRVTSTVPTNKATGVAPLTNITATFSEDMDASTINTNTFKVFEISTGTKLSGTVSYNAQTDTATYNPTESLKLGVTYRAVVSTKAKDLAGNPLDQNTTKPDLQQKRWSFEVVLQ